MKIEPAQADDPEIQEKVKAALDRVVASELFKNTTRMKRFLTYIVDETLAGRADYIKGYTLGIEVFDRPDDFDPQDDTIVRVQAGQLRRRLDLYYAKQGKSDEIRITIPKGSYIPVFERRLFAITRPDAVDITAQKLAAEPPAKDLVDDSPGPKVLVTNFETLGNQDEDQLFALGLTAEFIHALNQYRYLSIISQKAVLTDATKSTDIDVLREKYGADYIVSGSIRRAGKVCRISVTLIDAETRRHVYSDSFDRQFSVDSLLDLQERVASQIAATIGAPYGIINRISFGEALSNPSQSAYEAVLKYYAFYTQPDTDKYKSVKAELERAVKDSPDYSPAWAALSHILCFAGSHDMRLNNEEELFEQALKMAWRAISIDPRNSFGYLALMAVQFHRQNTEQFRRAAAQAIDLNPTDDNLIASYAVALALVGDLDNAINLSKQAQKLNPDGAFWYSVPQIIKMILDGHFADAARFIEPQLQFYHPWGALVLAACYGYLGETKKLEQVKAELDRTHISLPRDLDKIVHVWNMSDELGEILRDGVEKTELIKK